MIREEFHPWEASVRLVQDSGAADNVVLRVEPEKAVRELQYEVREGREAGEAVVLVSAFIADCNSSFILQFDSSKEVDHCHA